MQMLAFALYPSDADVSTYARKTDSSRSKTLSAAPITSAINSNRKLHPSKPGDYHQSPRVIFSKNEGGGGGGGGDASFSTITMSSSPSLASEYWSRRASSIPLSVCRRLMLASICSLRPSSAASCASASCLNMADSRSFRAILHTLDAANITAPNSTRRSVRRQRSLTISFLFFVSHIIQILSPHQLQYKKSISNS